MRKQQSSDYDPDYQQVVLSPNLFSRSNECKKAKYESTNTSPVQNPKSALSHFDSKQDRKLKKLQISFSKSIRQAESSLAVEAMQSADIQKKLTQLRTIGTNIKKNLLPRVGRTSVVRIHQSREPDISDLKPKHQSTNIIDKYPKNDYQAYLDGNKESFSALNTLSIRNSPQITKQTQSMTAQTLKQKRNQNTGDHKTISSILRKDDADVASIGDSIMSRECDVTQIKDSFDHATSHNFVNSYGQHNTHNNQSNSKNCSGQSEGIFDLHLQQAKNSFDSQSRVQRLIQMNYVVNSINSRFKSSMLNKFHFVSYNERNLSKNGTACKNIGSKASFVTDNLSGYCQTSPIRLVDSADTAKPNEHAQIQEPAEKKSDVKDAPFHLQKINIDDFREANRILRESQPNLKELLKEGYMRADEDLQDAKFKNLGSLVLNRQHTTSKISQDLRLQTQSTCQNIDNIIKHKKDQEIINVKLLRAILDKDIDVQAEESHDLEDPRTSSLEKKRRRIVSQFEHKIKQQKKLLEEVQNFIESNVDPDEKAQRVLSKLKYMSTDSDPDLKAGDIAPDTARFLADLISDVMDNTEKHKMLQKLSQKLQVLIDQKVSFDQKMKNKIQAKRAESDVKKLLEKGIFQLNFQAMKHKEKEKKTGVKSKFIFVNQIEQNKQKPQKGSLKTMMRRHYNTIIDRQMDIASMSKRVNMLKQFEAIFKQAEDLGVFYKNMNKQNLWANDYLRHNDVEIDFLDNQKKLKDINCLYQNEVEATKFYNDLKKEKVTHLEASETEKLANLNLKTLMESSFQTTLPTFARMFKNELNLSEVLFTDQMAQALEDYLKAVRQNPQKQVKQLQIDNCNMKDGQLARILRGVQAQGPHLRMFVYSCGEFGSQSAEILSQFLPTMQVFCLNSLSKSLSKSVLTGVLSKIESSATQIQKFKLSNMNLSDNEIINGICRVIFTRVVTLTNLDLSWTKMQPKQLHTIMRTLVNLDYHDLRSLNLSYNSLIQPAHQEKPHTEDATCDSQHVTCEFVNQLCQYLRLNNLLNHIDLSGMNFTKKQILQIVDSLLLESDNLLAIHLSDNGIGFDLDLRDEILDKMGLSKSIFRILKDEEFKNNQRIPNPENLKKVIRKHTLSLKRDDYQNSAQIDANSYASRLLQTKQNRQVTNNMNQHKVIANGGIGRLESNLVDQFVFGRQTNRAELVFNQQPYNDKYFEIDAAAKWRLYDSACGISGGCPVCNRHKYSLIFYEQCLHDPWSLNQDLIEIKDKKIVDQIKEDLNISFRYDTDIAPIIVGSIVTGGFKRKLKMVRADYFSMLSITDSLYTIINHAQSKAIKRGLVSNLASKQDIQANDIHLQYLHGWHKELITDKCFRNEIDDVLLINFPQRLKLKENSLEELSLKENPSISMESPLPKKDDLVHLPNRECTIFVYAAQLPPGFHQFLLYCPKTHRAFCKDFIVDLSQSDPYPEYPEPLKRTAKEQKPTRQNVWRLWHVDGNEQIKLAFLADTKGYLAQESGFVKDTEDLSACNQILVSNFELIQTTFIELIALDPQNYPRIPFEIILNKLLIAQKTNEEKKKLPKALIELSFISTTQHNPEDTAKKLQGTLSRGQYIELILRLTKQCYPKTKKISSHLMDFLDTYIKPIRDASHVVQTREKLRESQTLNQLLFDNREALGIIFEDYKEYAKGFTMKSARMLLNALCSEDPEKEEHLIPQMQKVFSFAKMTILQERQDKHLYHQLQYVEFLDFLSRVAIELGKKEPGAEQVSVHVAVSELLKRIWEFRASHPERIPPRAGAESSKIQIEFPGLIPPRELDIDENE